MQRAEGLGACGSPEGWEAGAGSLPRGREQGARDAGCVSLCGCHRWGHSCSKFSLQQSLPARRAPGTTGHSVSPASCLTPTSPPQN